MAEHELKTLPPYFEDVLIGRKTFEVRKDDRGVQVGDILRLREWDGIRYTGRDTTVRVTYILSAGQDHSWGLADGYVVLGIEPADAAVREAVLRQAAREAGLRCLTAEQADWLLDHGLSEWFPDSSDPDQRQLWAELSGEEASADAE